MIIRSDRAALRGKLPTEHLIPSKPFSPLQCDSLPGIYLPVQTAIEEIKSDIHTYDNEIPEVDVPGPGTV